MIMKRGKIFTFIFELSGWALVTPLCFVDYEASLLNYFMLPNFVTIYLPILYCSLVPRPFPPLVFDRLQYANTEGKGLGDLVTCSDVGLYRQRVYGHTGRCLKKNFKAFSCTVSPRAGVQSISKAASILSVVHGAVTV